MNIIYHTKACLILNRRLRKLLFIGLASALWFNHNGRDDPTSFSYTKDISWKIKTSTRNLPTLDILNRNYPKLIKDRTTCLLCTQATETNEHIWNCPVLFHHIKFCFLQLATTLENLLITHGDKLTTAVTDTIKTSLTFRWSFSTPDTGSPLPQHALLLLQSYITTDLYQIFRLHFKTIKPLYSHLLNFMQEAIGLFKSNIWKVRSQAWKEWKLREGITKQDFKNYYTQHRTPLRSERRNHEDFTPSSQRLKTDWVYSNPINNFRNYKNQSDLLFIIFSSNFLHDGFFFNHLSIFHFLIM